MTFTLATATAKTRGRGQPQTGRVLGRKDGA